MSRGCVYLWTPDPERPAGGYVTTSVVPLERLENGSARTARLRGRFVVVRNGGAERPMSSRTRRPGVPGRASRDRRSRGSSQRDRRLFTGQDLQARRGRGREQLGIQRALLQLRRRQAGNLRRRLDLSP